MVMNSSTKSDIVKIYHYKKLVISMTMDLLGLSLLVITIKRFYVSTTIDSDRPDLYLLIGTISPRM